MIDKNVYFKIKNGTMIFSKSETLSIYDTLLKELNNDLKLLEMKLANKMESDDSLNLLSIKFFIKEINIVKSYLNSKPKVFLEYKPLPDVDTEENTDAYQLSIVSRRIAQIIPEMLDSGKFRLIINGKVIDKMVKAEVSMTNDKHTSTSSLMYLVNKGNKVFWDAGFYSCDVLAE